MGPGYVINIPKQVTWLTTGGQQSKNAKFNKAGFYWHFSFCSCVQPPRHPRCIMRWNPDTTWCISSRVINIQKIKFVELWIRNSFQDWHLVVRFKRNWKKFARPRPRTRRRSCGQEADKGALPLQVEHETISTWSVLVLVHSAQRFEAYSTTRVGERKTDKNQWSELPGNSKIILWCVLKFSVSFHGIIITLYYALVLTTLWTSTRQTWWPSLISLWLEIKRYDPPLSFPWDYFMTLQQNYHTCLNWHKNPKVLIKRTRRRKIRRNGTRKANISVLASRGWGWETLVPELCFQQTDWDLSWL